MACTSSFPVWIHFKRVSTVAQPRKSCICSFIKISIVIQNFFAWHDYASCLKIKKWDGSGHKTNALRIWCNPWMIDKFANQSWVRCIHAPPLVDSFKKENETPLFWRQISEPRLPLRPCHKLSRIRTNEIFSCKPATTRDPKSLAGHPHPFQILWICLQTGLNSRLQWQRLKHETNTNRADAKAAHLGVRVVARSKDDKYKYKASGLGITCWDNFPSNGFLSILCVPQQIQ